MIYFGVNFNRIDLDKTINKTTRWYRFIGGNGDSCTFHLLRVVGIIWLEEWNAGNSCVFWFSSVLYRRCGHWV